MKIVVIKSLPQDGEKDISDLIGKTFEVYGRDEEGFYIDYNGQDDYFIRNEEVVVIE